MVTVTKKRSVLDLDGAYFDTVYFTRQPDDPTDIPAYLRFSKSVWEEMGSPGVITISIEPGDLLNEEQ